MAGLPAGWVVRVRVRFFATFRDLASATEMDVELGPRARLARLLEAVFSKHPALRAELVDEAGGLWGHVAVLVNGRNVRDLQGEATELRDGDEVALFPPVAGG